jgi:hypothetical protein
MSDDWKEKQARLLQDIEAFARSKPDLAAANVEEKRAPRAAAPAFQADPAPKPAAAAQPEAAAPPPAAPAAQPSGSLLERLKREAQAKRMTDSQVLATQGQVQRGISDALQATFQYLREFCDQLNVLKPPYPLNYGLLGIVQLDGLTWQEGRADFRLLPEAKEDRLLEQVTLRFRLASGQRLRVERENPAHQAFRTALIEANIAYHEEEFRNQKSHVERAVYTFPAEVKAGLAFSADYQMGDIRLLVRNIRRFGAAEYRVPFEMLGQEVFEEIGKLVLGEDNRIDRMFRRVA